MEKIVCVCVCVCVYVYNWNHFAIHFKLIHDKWTILQLKKQNGKIRIKIKKEKAFLKIQSLKG